MTTLEASTAVADLSASSDHTTASAAPAVPFPWDTAEPCTDRLETGSYSTGDFVSRNGILVFLSKFHSHYMLPFDSEPFWTVYLFISDPNN